MTMPFGDLQVDFDDRVLRPRAWTLAQSDWAVELLPPTSGAVLELCAGAGHIGLATMARHDRDLVMVDASAVACEFARRNAERAGLLDRVEVRCGRAADAVGPEERFALVVADPPWVLSAATDRFPEDPLTAIDGGVDGLDVAKECLTVAGRCLTDDGVAVIQLGDVQQVRALTAWLDSDPSLRLHAAEHRLFADGVLLEVRRRDGS